MRNQNKESILNFIKTETLKHPEHGINYTEIYIQFCSSIMKEEINMCLQELWVNDKITKDVENPAGTIYKSC